MKPTDILGNTKLYNADCMEILRQTPDKYYDLSIVDPPYGIGASSKNFIRQGKQTGKSMAVSGMKYTAKDWDNCVPDKIYFEELRRVSKNQIVWGGNYFDLPPTRGMICWDKIQPWENFSQFELAWSSFDKPAAMYRLSNTGGANAEKRIHPTQKPVKLYEWLLNKYAKPEDKILDTHGGSFSHAIACHKQGFQLSIIEIDEQYFNDAVKRLKWEQRQLQLNFTI